MCYECAQWRHPTNTTEASVCSGDAALLARQASASRLILCRCYTFLFFLFKIFLNELLAQRDLRNYKTDLHQLFRNGRHVGVDVHSGIGFAIGQGTLPWQPILSAKSAEIGDTPSFSGLAFHNGWQREKADGRVSATEVF